MYSMKSPSLRITSADLKCKRGCGFYGNADWDGRLMKMLNVCILNCILLLGFCSQCYRNALEKERQKKREKKAKEVDRQSTGSSSSSNSKPHVEFLKFEEKKRQQTDKKNKLIKNLTPNFKKLGKLHCNSMKFRSFLKLLQYLHENNTKLFNTTQINELFWLILLLIPKTFRFWQI